MINTVYNIYGNLFQGPRPIAGDSVSQDGFDVLVLCAWENQDASAYTGVEVIQAPGEDLFSEIADPSELEAWKQAAVTVADRLKAGKRVLVTCIGGYNRSGIVTAMTMSHLTDWEMDDIVSHVKMKRPGALFNKAFVKWLNTQFGKDDQNIGHSAERDSDLPNTGE